MKFFSLSLILVLTLSLVLLEAKKSYLSLRTKSKSKSHKSHKQDFPKTLGILKQQLFPIPLVEQNKSIIEEDPSSYSLMNPLSHEENQLLTPEKIYEKDKSEFGMTPANLSDIKPNQIYLVKNMTFLRTVPGFEDPNDAYKPVEHLPPVYHKDKAAYYNPVGNIRNMYKKRREGLYSVPIEIFANGTRLFEENKEKLEIKNRLKRDKRAYYDPFYMPLVDILDPLNKTLIRAAKQRLSPPAQQYDEYLKDKEREKYHIDLLLGKKEEIPRTFGKDEGLEQALQKATTQREADMVAEEVKTDFHLNKKKKDPYYDPSLKRFKQLNNKKLNKKTHGKHRKSLKL